MKTVRYRIYQLPRKHPDLFLSYSRAEKRGIRLRDYKEVYQDEIMDEGEQGTLETLYTKFNVARPEDYTGHSLSVSDIIYLEGYGAYYCDCIGWKQVF